MSAISIYGESYYEFRVHISPFSALSYICGRRLFYEAYAQHQAFQPDVFGIGVRSVFMLVHLHLQNRHRSHALELFEHASRCKRKSVHVFLYADSIRFAKEDQRARLSTYFDVGSRYVFIDRFRLHRQCRQKLPIPFSFRT